MTVPAHGGILPFGETGLHFQVLLGRDADLGPGGLLWGEGKAGGGVVGEGSEEGGRLAPEGPVERERAPEFRLLEICLIRI